MNWCAYFFHAYGRTEDSFFRWVRLIVREGCGLMSWRCAPDRVGIVIVSHCADRFPLSPSGLEWMMEHFSHPVCPPSLWHVHGHSCSCRSPREENSLPLSAYSPVGVHSSFISSYSHMPSPPQISPSSHISSSFHSSAFVKNGRNVIPINILSDFVISSILHKKFHNNNSSLIASSILSPHYDSLPLKAL